MKEERKKDNNGPYAIWEIVGGLGKNILSLAVINAFKKSNPQYRVVVVPSFDAPFYYVKEIEKVLNFGQTPYFYDDYIFENSLIYRIDPYHTCDHILQRKHLIQTWCDLYNIPYNGELPKIYLNPREIEIARDKIKPDSGKPIFLLQTNGGAPGQYSKRSWARDIPLDIAQKVVNYFSKSYRILHIRREDQPQLQGVEPLILPHRELFAVFTFSKKRLFMDSFGQHAAAALGLPSVVCWIVNKPSVFGYKIHKDIFPNANKIFKFNKYSYVDEYDISGQIQQFPYDTVNLFDVNEIIEALKSI